MLISFDDWKLQPTNPMQKTLDSKLSDIWSNPASSAFIICYAADGDMGGGMRAFVDGYPSLHGYVDHLQTLVEQAELDILLASVSMMDSLARGQRLFDHSSVTPAIRANDTTDIWGPRGSSYNGAPSKPFATTTIEEAQYGVLTPAPGQVPDVNLGLYSITFNNDLESDWFALERFKQFRVEATRKGMRYFLEVFNPNAPVDLSEDAFPDFVNDSIARMLAGIPRASRPDFLKVVYNGPKAMEDLVNYTTITPGILGGPASTTYDAYKLIAEAKKYGARVALFGRRIKDADDPLAFTAVLRRVADGDVTPEEGVRVYRDQLEKAGIRASRSFDEDMTLHTAALVKSLGKR